MPDITVSDPNTAAGAVIDVHLEASVVRVIGSELNVEVTVDTGGSQVVIEGTPLDDNIWLRVRLEWNGGQTNPTVISYYPRSAWDQDAYYNGVIVWATNFPQEFAIRHEYQTTPPSLTPSIGHTVGTSFNGIGSVSYSHQSPISAFRFGMLLNGVAVYPADGDACTITIYFT